MKKFSKVFEKATRKDYKVSLNILTKNGIEMNTSFVVSEHVDSHAREKSNIIAENITIDKAVVTDIEEMKEIKLSDRVKYYDFTLDGKGMAVNMGIIKRILNTPTGKYFELEIIEDTPDSIHKEGSIDYVSVERILKK